MIERALFQLFSVMISLTRNVDAQRASMYTLPVKKKIISWLMDFLHLPSTLETVRNCSTLTFASIFYATSVFVETSAITNMCLK